MVSERLSPVEVWRSLVWIPMLPADSLEAAIGAAQEFASKGVRQFYDAERVIGRAVAERLGAAGNIAWDVYLLYAPGSSWAEPFPRPEAWLHQLSDPWADPGLRRRGPALANGLAEVLQRYTG